MTRLLTGLLAALSIFISVNIFAFDENPVPWVQPKVDNHSYVDCNLGGGNVSRFESAQACGSHIENSINSVSGRTEADCSDIRGQYIYCTYNRKIGQNSNFEPIYDRTNPEQYAVFYPKSENAKVCPPDEAPDYTIGPVTAPDGTPEVCITKFEKCPLGFFANAITPSGGQSQCVPIQCPSNGTESQFFNHGQISVGSSGTYCDGKCAYSISPDQGVNYDGASFASGTATGDICGQGSTKDSFYQPLGDNQDSCTQHPLTSGGTYLECSAQGVDTPEPETSEGDLSQPEQDSSVDPTTQPESFQGSDCTTSNSEISCVGENITDAIEHQTKEQKKLDDEKHNKLVKMEKETAEYLEQKERERQSKAFANSAQETQMIVNAITNIGGGSGNGNGDGEGDNNDLIEDYLPEPILADFDSALSNNADKLDQAQSDLDTSIENALSNFNQNDGVWSNFKTIPNYLPADAVCQPFELGLEPHTIQLDLCQYNDIIKAAISFIFIILTALRLFYQSQRIIRNVALAQG